VFFIFHFFAFGRQNFVKIRIMRILLGVPKISAFSFLGNGIRWEFQLSFGWSKFSVLLVFRNIVVRDPKKTRKSHSNFTGLNFEFQKCCQSGKGGPLKYRKIPFKFHRFEFRVSEINASGKGGPFKNQKIPC